MARRAFSAYIHIAPAEQWKGRYWVFCERCERTLGDAVPLAMAEDKAQTHDLAHQRREVSSV